MRQKKVFEKYSTEELADAFVFRNKLSVEDQRQVVLDLAEAREKSRKEAKKSSPLLFKLLQLKFQMENCINQPYDASLSFGSFLKKYLKILELKQLEFAKGISVDETYVSHIINGRREPNEELIIRLELHSKNLISALLWYKLLEKEKENEINTSTLLRKRERKFIKSTVELR